MGQNRNAEMELKFYFSYGLISFKVIFSISLNLKFKKKISHYNEESS